MIALFWNSGISTSPVLALYCEKKMQKIQTSFKTFVSKKATMWWLKESQSKNNFLTLIMPSSYLME